MPDEIRRAVLFRAESEPTELRKRVFGPRSLDFGVRGPLRFESGLGFSLPIPLCLIWSGAIWSLETVCAGTGGRLAVRPSSLIALCGVWGWVKIISLRAVLGGHWCTTAHYRLQGVSWCIIRWGHKKSLPRPVLTQLMWGGFRSFLEIVRGVTVEHEMISRGAVRLHLQFLGWRGSTLGRLITDLGRKGSEGGNAFPWQHCILTAVSVLQGLSLSSPFRLMWSGKRKAQIGPQMARRCNMG